MDHNNTIVAHFSSDCRIYGTLHQFFISRRNKERPILCHGENNGPNRFRSTLAPSNSDCRRLNDGGVKRAPGRQPIHHNTYFAHPAPILHDPPKTRLFSAAVDAIRGQETVDVSRMKLFSLLVQADVSICSEMD